MHNSSVYVQLLNDVAPELAFRSICSEANRTDAQAPTPELYRALISTLLRASSHPTLYGAESALVCTLRLPTSDARSRLGFTSQTTVALSRTILHDVLSALARGAELHTENAALCFYNNAGAGCADIEEYAADMDRDRSDVRTRALCILVRYFAAVVKSARDNGVPLRFACTESRLLEVVTKNLRECIGSISEDAWEALREFFEEALKDEPEQELDDVIRRLISAMMEIAASDHSEDLIVFASALPGSELRFRVCKGYLEQRFGIKCEQEKEGNGKLTLHVKKLVKYFDVKVLPSRRNQVLPATLSVMTDAWMDFVDDSCFRFSESGEKLASAVEKIIKKFTLNGKRLSDKCNATTRDALALRATVVAICSRISSVNSTPAY